MALTLNNLVGFETDGLEEASASSGSPAAVATIVRTGTYALELQASDQYDISPFESVADAGDRQIIGFAFQPDTTPTVDVDFLQVLEGATVILRIRWEATSADLILVDAAGTEVDTIVNPFTNDQWHYVELVWQHLDSGAADVEIDGAASGLSVTTTDFNGGGTFDTYRFDNPASGPNIYFDDVYCMSGAAGASDFLGPRTEVLGAYQNTVEDATDQGSALVTGTWANVGETPGTTAEADYAQNPAIEGYTICDEGNRVGPAGDALGTITGAKFLHRLKRTTGSSPDTLDQSYGNSGDGVTKTDRAAALTTAYQNFFIVSESASIVPTNSENFAQGIGQTGSGGRDIFCEEIWAFLLHVHALPTTLADLNFPDQNYYIGPFGT